jgi:hypothetical protein
MKMANDCLLCDASLKPDYYVLRKPHLVDGAGAAGMHLADLITICRID